MMFESPNEMRRPIPRYVALAVLFAIAVADRVGTGVTAVELLANGGDAPQIPAPVQVMTRTIGGGPYYGHQIFAVDGKPLDAYRQYLGAARDRKPGQTVQLTLAQPSGNVIERTLPIPSQRAEYTGLTNILQTVCEDIVVPLIALVVGFGAAFIRPRDKHAWLLLAIMMSCVELLRRTDAPFYTSDAVVVWSSFWTAGWPSWMLLFAVSFPQPLGLDRKRPWLKWLLVVPLLCGALLAGGLIVLWLHDTHAALAFRPFVMRLRLVQTVGGMLAIGGFFAALGYKRATAVSADDRRRLKILSTGASIGLTPTFLLVIISLVRGYDMYVGIPVAITIASILMMCVLPLTLAYVVVVERAMDLSFVIRQSLRYGIARGGLWTARAVVLSIALVVFRSAAPDEKGNGGRPLVMVATGVGLLMLRKRFADRASQWVDRKFFREAYNVEVVLGDLATEAGRYVEIDPLLQKVAQRLSDTLHVPAIVVLLREGDAFVPRYSTRDGEAMGIAASSRIVQELNKQQDALEIYFDKPPLWLRSLTAVELQTLDWMRSQVLLPLVGQRNQELVGIASLGPKLSEVPYSTTDIRLLRAVAAQMALALENSRLIASLAAEAAERERANRELEIAREVQERLFPQRSPNVPGFDCAGYCRPARGVGGDYYDFIDLSEGRIGIAIGDVSGKGIAAALMMASLQASLRGQTMAQVSDLPALMHNVNKLLYDASTSNRYATFFYGEFDPKTLRMDFVNAGHNAPVILRGDEVVRLEAGGPVVGLLPRALFGGDSCQLQPGDTFIAFTDGISEAQAESEEEWEEDRFIAAALACRELPARKMIDAIFQAADVFTGKAKQYDDMTLVVFKLAST